MIKANEINKELEEIVKNLGNVWHNNKQKEYYHKLEETELKYVEDLIKYEMTKGHGLCKIPNQVTGGVLFSLAQNGYAIIYPAPVCTDSLIYSYLYVCWDATKISYVLSDDVIWVALTTPTEIKFYNNNIKLFTKERLLQIREWNEDKKLWVVKQAVI